MLEVFRIVSDTHEHLDLELYVKAASKRDALNMSYRLLGYEDLRIQNLSTLDPYNRAAIMRRFAAHHRPCYLDTSELGFDTIHQQIVDLNKYAIVPYQTRQEKVEYLLSEAA